MIIHAGGWRAGGTANDRRAPEGSDRDAAATTADRGRGTRPHAGGAAPRARVPGRLLARPFGRGLRRVLRRRPDRPSARLAGGLRHRPLPFGAAFADRKPGRLREPPPGGVGRAPVPPAAVSRRRPPLADRPPRPIHRDLARV